MLSSWVCYRPPGFIPACYNEVRSTAAYQNMVVNLLTINSLDAYSRCLFYVVS